VGEARLRRHAPCRPLRELSAAERSALIAKDPAYGRIVCRCETVTEGEILAALRAPIPPTTINGVKRRVGAGMGRCQGGFCAPRVHELLVRELGLDWLDVCLEAPGSEVLAYETKKEAAR
jgi:glycerol-3-phosphate dehydrogenase